MNEKALKTLEYDKIVSLLAKLAVSEQGREKCAQLKPSPVSGEVARRLNETEEAVWIIQQRGSSPMQGFDDIRPSLARLKVEAVLSMGELLKIARFLQAVRLANDISNVSGAGSVGQMAASLVPMRDIETEIFASIISEDEMSDNASRSLASIRKQIRVQNDRVKEKLSSLVRSLGKDGVLQDNIITMRSGRYVLPVLTAHKAQVTGIVHDQSSSGATLFIEPTAVVEINNAIRQLHLDERDEIERILAEFSSRLPHELLESNMELLCELDFIFAKARLAREMKASVPQLNSEGYIDLKRARHPLLAVKNVVPINVWLGKDFTQLIVTGPNTGGKTVTLKTVGLLTLMAQAGLEIPADPGSSTSVFDNVFADIGDEQSIEQNLSTFSSHIKNIAEIMKGLSPNSLVLFDELGAGTDPTEGAALAMSILEELRVRRIRAVATSHYSELKVYALSKEDVQNASVEFDVVSLSPTYRLLVGIPGNSNAFLISERLGLEKYLIDRASGYISEESRKLEDVLSTAEDYRLTAQREKEISHELRRELDIRRAELENQKKQIQIEREKIIERAQLQANEISENAVKKANDIIKNMQELSNNAGGRELFKARELRRELEGMKKQEKQKKSANVNPIDKVEIGQAVYVTSIDSDGIVTSLPNTRGEVDVTVGSMKIKVKQKDLACAVHPEQMKKQGSVKITKASVAVPLELDVRGQMSDEAIVNVDLYLDAAYSAGFESVTIIHGKGTGALRAAITQHLKKHSLVSSCRMGAYGEGDAGVTVVQLKK